MRAVWITHNYPRHSGDVAGNFLHPLAVALRALDVDVRVIAPADQGNVGDHTLDGVPIRRVRYDSPAHEQLAYRGTMAGAVRSPRGLLALARLRRALQQGAAAELDGDRGTVVHAHWWIPGGLAVPRDSRYVLTSHGTDVRLLEQVPMSGWLARGVYRRARLVTTVSSSLAEVITRRTGVGVQADAIQPMPLLPHDRPRSDRSGPVVVIGRLTRQKRVELAIDALAGARAAGASWRLRVVGDGPARADLERQARDRGVVGAVEFIGAVAPDAVPGIMATAACCVTPAREEGFGLVAAEALIQGVPVVACVDGGGLTEIVTAAGAGRLVPPQSLPIAAAIAQLLADPDAGAAAMAAGAGWRARLDPVAVAQRCITWYQQALDV